MGGWRHIVGDPDRPAARMGISIGDSLAATYGCMGALAALHHRERTGHGQIVDSSLYESVLQVMESLIPEYALTGFVRERTGSILPNVAPSNVYRCRDGEYLIGANQDSVFRRLCAAMGQPDLADDPRYSTHSQRGIYQRELDERIEAWTRSRLVAEVEATMIEYGIPAGKIFRAADMLSDPHFKARGSILEVEHPKWGRFPMQNAFPRLSATPTGFRTLAPQRVGEHNREVLEGILGLAPERIEALSAQGVV
jgi:formyl-CoA transferase